MMEFGRLGWMRMLLGGKWVQNACGYARGGEEGVVQGRRVCSIMCVERIWLKIVCNLILYFRF